MYFFVLFLKWEEGGGKKGVAVPCFVFVEYNGNRVKKKKGKYLNIFFS